VRRLVWIVSLTALLLAAAAAGRVFGGAPILTRPDQRAIPMLISKSRTLLNYGTGVVVGSSTVLTAEHVLVGKTDVRLPRGTVAGRTICQSRSEDLAVLRASLPKGTPYYRLSFRMPAVGETVRVGGYPDRHWMVATGRVTHIIQSAVLGGRTVHSPLIVFEPAIHHGASGAPVLDRKGRVLGIFVASNTRANYSIAFPNATGLRTCGKFVR
jgi:S1-C subfamily serine protease